VYTTASLLSMRPIRCRLKRLLTSVSRVFNSSAVQKTVSQVSVSWASMLDYSNAVHSALGSRTLAQCSQATAMVWNADKSLQCSECS
jgi:hypothetical protein